MTHSEAYANLLSNWNSAPAAKGEIVLIGNSLCVEYPLDSIGSRPLTKLAMRGDVIANLSRRIPILENRNPELMILCMGVNDILNTGKFDREGYEQFVERVTQDVGGQLVLLSLSPVSFESGIFSNADQANRTILESNILIQDMAHRHGARYLNVHSGLSRNGELDEKFTYDGLHLTEEGYRIWEEKFNSLLEEK